MENQFMKRISLIGKNGEGKYTIVDDEDYSIAARHRWSLDKDGYAVSRGLRLSRLILGSPAGALVDHKNSDRLDNTRENLRIASHAQNAQNRVNLSHRKYKGVYRGGSGRFRAVCHGKDLGLYETRDLAALAYNEEAIAQYGEFAHLNDVELV